MSCWTVGLAVLVVLVGVNMAPAVIITSLDFEDGQLPSAHGWTSFGGGSSSIVQDDTKGSKVLEVSGSSHFGWTFDVEVLFVAQRRGYKIIEIPIPWHYHPGSRVRIFKDTLAMFSDIIRIRLNALRGVYAPD